MAFSLTIMFSRFVHVAYVSTSILLWIIPHCVDRSYFIYSFIISWCVFGFFLTIVNNAAVNISIQFLCDHMFSLLSIYLRVEFLFCLVPLSFTFWGKLDSSPKQLHYVTFPLAVYEGSCLHIFTSTCYYLLFWLWFWLAFFWQLMLLSIFLYMCWLLICMSSLEKCLFRSLPILKIELSFYWIVKVLCLFCVQVLHQMWGLQFLPFCGLSVHFLAIDPWSTKFIILMQSNSYCFFFFCSLCFCCHI